MPYFLSQLKLPLLKKSMSSSLRETRSVSYARPQSNFGLVKTGTQLVISSPRCLRSKTDFSLGTLTTMTLLTLKTPWALAKECSHAVYLLSVNLWKVKDKLIFKATSTLSTVTPLALGLQETMESLELLLTSHKSKDSWDLLSILNG